MAWRWNLAFTALILFLSDSAWTRAAVNPAQTWGSIPYTGHLERGGVAVSTPMDFCFSLHDAATGGTRLWSEAQPNIILSRGDFAVHLGTVTTLTPAVETSPNLFLEVGVAAAGTGGPCPGAAYTMLGGRQSIGSAGFSLSAKRGVPGQDFLVDGNLTAGSLTTAGTANTGALTATSVTSTGALNVSGAMNIPNGSISGARLAPDPIACNTWTATVSNIGGGPKTALAIIGDASYARTGGGCDCGSAAPGRLVVVSIPISTNGWACGCKDHTSGDGNGSTTAYVIGCRLR